MREDEKKFLKTNDFMSNVKPKKTKTKRKKENLDNKK